MTEQPGAFPELRAELHEAMTWNGLSRAASRFCIFGSAVMYLHGLRQTIGDIDMFVTPALYVALKAEGWEEQWPREGDPPLLEKRFDPHPDARPGDIAPPPAHAFFAWKTRGMPIDVPALLDSPRMVDHWPVQSLKQLRDWKLSIAHDPRRPNDLQDVIKIDEYLEGFPGA